MGMGTTVKTWWAAASKNKRLAEIMASNTMKSVGRWSMAGGAIGGIQGAARRIGGDREASISGGVISGMFAGAGARGFRAGWKRAFGKSAPIKNSRKVMGLLEHGGGDWPLPGGGGVMRRGRSR